MRCFAIGKCSAWLNDRISSEGWDDLGDRVEVLWGPDYRGHHDLFHFIGTGMTASFAAIPDEVGVPLIDIREEIEALLRHP